MKLFVLPNKENMDKQYFLSVMLIYSKVTHFRTRKPKSELWQQFNTRGNSLLSSGTNKHSSVQ